MYESRLRPRNQGNLLSLAALLIALPMVCGAQQSSNTSHQISGQTPAQVRQDDFNSAIQHIVFIMKENRSFDSYFGTYPNADGATEGTISTGQVIPLSHAGDRLVRDFTHTWNAFVTSSDNGRLDDFDLVNPCNVNGDYLCYSQLYQQDLPNYWSYAQHFVLADETFAGVRSPSYNQHIFAVAASTAGSIDDPAHLAEDMFSGCDAAPGATVPVLSSSGAITNQYPCFDIPSLTDELDAAGVSWKYYSGFESLYNGLLSIDHVRNGPDWDANVFIASQFLTDVQNGKLPSVSWLVPPAAYTEHPINPTCLGENWTVQQINAIMQSPYWQNTAIFLTWDESDGMYDHVPPPDFDQFGPGLRVPLIIISPYAIAGQVTHTVYDFSSILKFIEERYSLAPLTLRDANANDTLDSFNFTESPLPPLILNARACPVTSLESLSFGSEQVGKTTPSRSVFVTNYGPGALTISSVTTPGQFPVTNQCPNTLPAPTKTQGYVSCPVKVTFKPASSGPQAGTLKVVDSDASSPQIVALSGNGTQVVLSPSLLNFGTEVVGMSSPSLSATLSNSGTTPVTINGITGTSEYTVTNNCGTRIGGHSSCSLTAVFSPAATGKRYGALTVSTSDPGSPQVVNMTGIGTTVTFEPTTINFGNQPLGSSSAAQSVILTNAGSAPVAISGIGFTGTSGTYLGEQTADFSQTNNCGSSVGAGMACTIMVTFTPQALGSRSGTLNVSDTFADSPQQVSLSGNGTAALRNAVPFLDALSPVSIPPGSHPVRLAVAGTGFISGAKVNWKGTALNTFYNSNHLLTANVSSTLLAAPGTAAVTVTNPGPGGGPSNALLLSVTQRTSTLNFNATSLMVGATPAGVAAADFDGDDVEDLAVANSGANTVTILHGNGNGTFAAASTLATGREPVSLAIGDFNNDGVNDVAVANLEDNTVEIFPGNGNGTFQPGTGLASVVAPVWMAAGDFNQDGYVDLAAADGVEPEVTILMGTGKATLQPGSTPPGAGLNPVWVQLGDYNRDGVLDLAEINNTARTLSTLLGNGDGTFKAVTSQPSTGNGPAAMAAGDFNSDGNLDIAIANEMDSTMTVYLGNGDGSFQAGVAYAVGAGPVGVATADLNGDGLLDLVTANHSAGTVSVLLGTGAGAFGTHTDFSAGVSPVGLALADFNNDGLMDLAVTDAGAGTVSILLQTTGGPGRNQATNNMPGISR